MYLIFGILNLLEAELSRVVDITIYSIVSILLDQPWEKLRIARVMRQHIRCPAVLSSDVWLLRAGSENFSVDRPRLGNGFQLL